MARRHRLIGYFLMTGLEAVSLQGGVAAQQDAATGVALDVRAGIAGHGAGDCHAGGTTAATIGLDLRTRGRWIASAAVDAFLYEAGCLEVQVGTLYMGQEVDIEGWPTIGPRASASLGYGFSVLGTRLELVGGLGLVSTRSDYGRRGGAVRKWRSWQGGGLAMRLRSGLAFQFELGRHQLAERYYLKDQDVLVAELVRWGRMWRLGLSYPILR